MLENHIQGFIKRFKVISFEPGFGFDAYESEDVLKYLSDPAEFNFKLKKITGSNILYGVDHALLRQTVLNKLPLDVALAIIKKKLIFHKLDSKLSEITNENFKDISEIQDIGMGSSVYKITFKSNQKYVLKKKDSNFQEFYCRLLNEINWPSYQTHYFENTFGQWELAEYIGGQDINKVLFYKKDTAKIEAYLAKKAALGDVLGCGDRHLENYLFHNNHVYSLDITYLFCPDNDEWTQKYIAGGVYEICLLQKYMADPPILGQRLQAFWAEYYKTLTELSDKKEIIFNYITEFFVKDPKKNQYLNYVQTNLTDPDNYLKKQKQLYMQSFTEMLERKKYKDLLQEIQKNNPETIEKDNYLKMYYLADKDRYSCFLHIGKLRDELFKKIKKASA